jgi:hypothetical protein
LIVSLFALTWYIKKEKEKGVAAPANPYACASSIRTHYLFREQHTQEGKGKGKKIASRK